ncbi:MAG: hypothetical protein PWP27_465 [Clostridiales bacterium]|nr:hypothetical protein [Clostridiales bacterium]
MTGVIVEIEGKEMVVVDRKGNFKKLKYKEGYRIGQEIDLQAIPTIRYTSMIQRMAAVAAVFILVIGTGLYSYYSPYSYVSMDINPSVEIILNRYERVLDVQPLNEDGKKIINHNYHFMHKKVDDAISELINGAHEANYLKDNDNNEIFITVSAPKPQAAQEIGRYVREYTAAGLKQSNINANVTVEDVTIQKRVQAKKEHISVGKLLLLEQLQKVSPAANIDEVKDKSVKDIIENIKKEKEKSKDVDKDIDKDKDKDKNLDKGKEENTKKNNGSGSKEQKSFQDKKIQKPEVKKQIEKKSEQKDDTSKRPDVSSGHVNADIQKNINGDMNNASEVGEESKIQEDIYKDIDKGKQEDGDEDKAKEKNEDNKNENKKNDDQGKQKDRPLQNSNNGDKADKDTKPGSSGNSNSQQNHPGSKNKP